MADGVTYGINFPFVDSYVGKYLDASDTGEEEVRSNLVHLLLTKKGTRYFLPDFGTRLYEYIFEPLDGPTFNDIESEIRDSVETYIPNLQITNIIVDSLENLGETDAANLNTDPNLDNRIYRIPGLGTKEYTAKVRVEYTITSDVFNSKDFVIINI